MSDQVWLVYYQDYEDRVPVCVFADEADAKAHADATELDVEALRLMPPGHQPAVIEAWTARAEVSPRGGTPPTIQRSGFSELHMHAVPAWARVGACYVADCAMRNDTLVIVFRGSDKDEVLRRCTERYEYGLKSMGLA